MGCSVCGDTLQYSLEESVSGTLSSRLYWSVAWQLTPLWPLTQLDMSQLWWSPRNGRRRVGQWRNGSQPFMGRQRSRKV